MNVKLVKRIDSIVGGIIAQLIPAPKQYAILPFATSQVLLIRPGGIGDAAHLIPAIQKFHSHFPSARIDVLAERRNQNAFALCPVVTKVYCYDKPGDILKVLGSSYDVMIDTEQWHRLSAVVTRLVRSPVKIGFGTNERQRMFTHTVGYSHEDYEVDSFNRLLSPLEIHQLEYVVPFITVPDEARTAAASLLAPLGEGSFVVIFPGASIPELRWSAERFQQVAETISSRGSNVVVVGGGEERPVGEMITVGGGLNLAGQTSLVETAAILEKSQLLISGDSGVLHIAVGLNVPTVSLFGPGRAHKWAPRGEKHIVLNKQLPCSPCTTYGTTPPCPYGARCMQEITVDEVVEAALSLLQKTGATIADCP